MLTALMVRITLSMVEVVGYCSCLFRRWRELEVRRTEIIVDLGYGWPWGFELRTCPGSRFLTPMQFLSPKRQARIAAQTGTLVTTTWSLPSALAYVRIRKLANVGSAYSPNGGVGYQKSA